MERSIRALLLTALLAPLTSCGPRCNIKKDEQVHFYPSYLYLSDDRQSWMMNVSGQIVRQDPHSIFSKSAMEAVNSLALLLPGIQDRLVWLEEHLQPFAVQAVEGKAVPVAIQKNTQRLPESAPDGYFEGPVKWPSASFANHPEWISFQNEPCSEDAPRFTGQALVIPDQGISVISDIEGTLRASVEPASKETASPIFGRPSKPVAGMGSRYTAWAAQGAVFHYVSSYPWQWLKPLQGFLTQEGFPQGTVHMRRLSIEHPGSISEAVSALGSLLQPSVASMQPSMEQLLQRFPHRQFILIGHSAGPDPEVYAALARRYPQQIRAIYIRQAPGSEKVRDWKETFNGLPADHWKVFSQPAELPALPA
jgi:phosphatidate phosphatase APP1